MAPGDGGQYVNPLPANARIGRTDMGVDVDLNPGDPIVAPGTSRVLGIMPNWYAGQPYIGLQLLDGPMKGRNYYVAEQIDPAVTAGQVIRQGQPIAHYAASGTGINRRRSPAATPRAAMSLKTRSASRAASAVSIASTAKSRGAGPRCLKASR